MSEERVVHRKRGEGGVQPRPTLEQSVRRALIVLDRVLAAGLASQRVLRRCCARLRSPRALHVRGCPLSLHPLAPCALLSCSRCFYASLTPSSPARRPSDALFAMKFLSLALISTLLAVFANVALAAKGPVITNKVRLGCLERAQAGNGPCGEGCGLDERWGRKRVSLERAS